METKTRKRGPKPSGVKKVVFYARVEPQVYERLEAYLAGGCPVGDSSATHVLETFQGGRESEKPTFAVAAAKVMDENRELMWKLRVSELEDKVRELEGKAVIPVVVETEEVAFLRARVAQLEKVVKAYEDQGKWGA